MRLIALDDKRELALKAVVYGCNTNKRLAGASFMTGIDSGSPETISFYAALSVIDEMMDDTIEAEPQWIPVTERLPEKKEYLAKAEYGTEYLMRLLIACKTDIVEYEIGYYDGFKWLSEMPMRKITDVVAWKPFLPLPEPPKDGGSA